MNKLVNYIVVLNGISIRSAPVSSSSSGSSAVATWNLGCMLGYLSGYHLHRVTRWCRVFTTIDVIPKPHVSAFLTVFLSRLTQERAGLCGRFEDTTRVLRRHRGYPKDTATVDHFFDIKAVSRRIWNCFE